MPVNLSSTNGIFVIFRHFRVMIMPFWNYGFWYVGCK